MQLLTQTFVQEWVLSFPKIARSHKEPVLENSADSLKIAQSFCSHAGEAAESGLISMALRHFLV